MKVLHLKHVVQNQDLDCVALSTELIGGSKGQCCCQNPMGIGQVFFVLFQIM